MTRQNTINKYKKALKQILKKNINLSSYCKATGIHYGSFLQTLNKLAKENEEISDLYAEYKECHKEYYTEITEPGTTEILRSDDGHIVGYSFNISRKVGGNFIGTLSRDQMDKLCSLYSRYGADLTAAQVALDFPEYSLDELNKIKKAFLIFKYSCPFAPHEVDEKSEEELHDLAIIRKTNNLTRTLEKNVLKDAQQINLKLTQKINELNEWKQTLNGVHIDITGLHTNPSNNHKVGQDIMLNLADLHIGAKLNSGALFDNEWNKVELHRRLEALLNNLDTLGEYNYIYLNLLGDMLDGMDGMTARRDHVMPQNMDNKEQFNTYLIEMIWFINELRNKCNYIEVHSVPSGNHTGDPEYFATYALKYAIKDIPGVNMTIFDTFIGKFDIGEDVFMLLHGKDPQFMKKPLPLHLTPPAVVWLNNYLDRSGYTSKYKPGHIHFIKGDLHTAGMDDNIKFDYRNCLSLFGDSDYSQMNYPSNGYGCSYTLIIKNNSGFNYINGEFKNF